MIRRDDRVRDAIRRRSVQRTPVAYLTGRKGFRHLELDVDPRVLVPRPETEHLVEALLGLPQSAELPPPPAGCAWPAPPAIVPSYGRPEEPRAADGASPTTDRRARWPTRAFLR